MKTFQKASYRCRGTVLILTLAFLTIITIMILGFVTTMRTERMASGSMAENERAKLIAESALAHAISLLRDNIPDPGDPTIETPKGEAKNWFTNPGRLTVIDSSEPPLVKAVSLHTGAAASDDPAQAVNLNARRLTTGKYPITGQDDPMWVSWANVLQDASAPPGPDNKIVGRYAFWIDDESSKINFNVARGKPDNVLEGKAGLPSDWSTISDGRDLISHLVPTFYVDPIGELDPDKATKYSLSDPASINLDILGVNIVQLEKDIEKDGFLINPEAIKSYASGDIEDFYEEQKFNLTPFSRSPEFNVFGKSRIYMSSQQTDLAVGPMYQHFTSSEQPMQFFGNYASVGNNTSADAQRMHQIREPVVTSLAKYLNRDDWPGMERKKFRWAVGTYGDQESDQIALNIADMGYWGTTSVGGRPNIQANHLHRWGGAKGAYSSANPPNNSMWKGPLSGKPMIPSFMGPQITEIACTVTVEDAGSGWYLKFSFIPEYYLPPGGYWKEMTDSDGTKYKAYHNPNSASNNYHFAYAPTYCSITIEGGTPSSVKKNTFSFANDIHPSNGKLRSLKSKVPEIIPLDDYTFKIMSPLYFSKWSRPIRSNEGNNNRVKFSGEQIVTVRLRFGTMTLNSLKLIQVAPGLVPKAEGGDTEMLDEDADATVEFSFRISDPIAATESFTQSLQISDPRISVRKSAWELYNGSSPGETDTIGFSNSNAISYDDSAASKWGMWNWLTTSYRAGAIGMFGFVPAGMQSGNAWDTLQFHDYTVGKDEIPDWVVLDLLAPNQPYPISYMNSTMGKINLNSKIYPEASAYFAPQERRKPLETLFQNLPNSSTVVDSIVDYQEKGGYFDYIGRVCEISGVADDSLGDTDFEKEVLIRNLAGLMTTQSNVFGIWGVAQTVKKNPASAAYGEFELGDVVTGEKRFYAVVERYVWPGRDGAPGNAEVKGAGVYASVANVGDGAPGSPSFVRSKDTMNSDHIWAVVDGPNEVTGLPNFMGSFPFAKTGLDSADNPIGAAMKYRIIYFKYLD